MGLLDLLGIGSPQNNGMPQGGGDFITPLSAAGLGMMTQGLGWTASNENPGDMLMKALKLQNEQGLKGQERQATFAILKQAGASDADAAKWSLNPQVAKIALDQLKVRGEREADAGLPDFFGGRAPAPEAAPASPGLAPQPSSGVPQADGTLPRGIRNNNPGNIEDGPFARSISGYAGSDGRFAKYETPENGLAAHDKLLQVYGTKHGINTVSGVVNRWAPSSDGNPVSAYANFVAKKIGVNPNDPIDLNDPQTRQKLTYAMGEFENGRTIGQPKPAVSDGGYNFLDAQADKPPVMAQGGDADSQKPVPTPLKATSGMQFTPEAVAAYKRKYPNASEKTMDRLWSKALEDKSTTDQKNYQSVYDQEVAAGRTPPPFDEWLTKQKKAGAQSISIGEKAEGEFEKKAAGLQAERLDGHIKQGDMAQRNMSDLTTLRQVSRSLGSQGKLAGLKEALGPYLESVGIPITGLSDIQLWTATIERMAPQQHVPGSGASTNMDMVGFKKGLGALSNNPEAREMILDTQEAIARNQVAQAEIASQVLNKEINRVQGEKQLRALPDPMTSFKEWRNKNPDAYAAAISNKPAGSQAPKMSAPDIDQSLANARAAIAKNPAVRDAVIKKLRENGLDASGL